MLSVQFRENLVVHCICPISACNYIQGVNIAIDIYIKIRKIKRDPNGEIKIKDILTFFIVKH